MKITRQHWMSRLALALRDARERGASALEWALIAAVVVVAATMIGAAVYNVVQDKTGDLESCANVAVGSDC